MKAEHAYHVGRDQLVSPKQILYTKVSAGIEKQGQAAGPEGEKQEDKEKKQEGGERRKEQKENQGKHDASNTESLPRAVLSVGESSGGTGERKEQRLAGEEQVVDQHPEKGLISGSSKDGLGEDMATEDIEEGRIEEGEEARAPKRLPAPTFVSKAEREEHELTHTPYRSWCHHCVRCRGRNAQHRKKEDEDRRGQVPRISFDYFFMSHHDESAHENPMLVMVDERTGDKYARAVGQKGLGEELKA